MESDMEVETNSSDQVTKKSICNEGEEKNCANGSEDVRTNGMKKISENGIKEYSSLCNGNMSSSENGQHDVKLISINDSKIVANKSEINRTTSNHEEETVQSSPIHNGNEEFKPIEKGSHANKSVLVIDDIGAKKDDSMIDEDMNNDGNHSKEDETDLKKDEIDSNKDEIDSNKDEIDSNEDEIDSNKDEIVSKKVKIDSKNDETDSNKDEINSKMDDKDMKKDTDSRKDENDSKMDEHDSKKDEISLKKDLKKDENNSNKVENDPDKDENDSKKDSKKDEHDSKKDENDSRKDLNDSRKDLNDSRKDENDSRKDLNDLKKDENGSKKDANPVNTVNIEIKKEAKYKLFEKCGTDTEDMRPMAKMLYTLGSDLCKQFIFKDLIRVQTKKKSQNRLADGDVENLDKLKDVHELLLSRTKNYSVDIDVKCTDCSFKTESTNVLEWHKEFAHGQEEGDFKCSYCDFVTRHPGAFFYHMECTHNRKGRIYMRNAFFNCPMCPFENSTRAALKKHLVKCEKSFNLKRNLEPAPTDCDIPLKKIKNAPSPQVKKQPAKPAQSIMPKSLQKTSTPRLPNQLSQSPINISPVNRPTIPSQAMLNQLAQKNAGSIRTGVMPTYNIGNTMFTLVNNAGQYMLQPTSGPLANQATRAPFPAGASPQLNPMPISKPTISKIPVQPLPAKPKVPIDNKNNTNKQSISKVKDPPPVVKASPNSPIISTSKTEAKNVTELNAQSKVINKKNQFEICEICGGFVKDRESLRIHFYWAHKVDINKEIFERKEPHLSCTICPSRFWTYQGYRWHQRMKHSSEGPKTKYFCAVCRSNQITNLLLHLFTAHKITIDMICLQKRCPVCGATFQSGYNTRLHLYTVHQEMYKDIPVLEQMIKKGITEDVMKSPSEQKKETNNKASVPVPTGLFENAANKKKFEPVCSICDLTFPNLEAFTSHCTQMHLHKCSRCGKKWSTAELLQEHYNAAHRNEFEECPICDESVNIGRPFIRHMKREHIKNCSVVVARLKPSIYDKYREKYMRESRDLKEKVAAAVLPLLEKHKQMAARAKELDRSEEAMIVENSNPSRPKLANGKKYMSASRKAETKVPEEVQDDSTVKSSNIDSSANNSVSVNEDILIVNSEGVKENVRHSESKNHNEDETLSENKTSEMEVIEIDGETIVVEKQSDDDDDDEEDNEITEDAFET